MSARSKSGRTGRRARASQFHSTSVEKKPRRLSSLISQALSFDDADAYAAGEVGFMARALVQATLPHSDPRTNEFVRHNGHYSLSILAPKDVGLPYGRYPRLVLAYLNTEAVKRRTRHIELDHHFSHFCAALGIPPTTGPRGSLPQLREQMQRLFASTFQCVFHSRGATCASSCFAGFCPEIPADGRLLVRGRPARLARSPRDHPKRPAPSRL